MVNRLKALFVLRAVNDQVPIREIGVANNVRCVVKRKDIVVIEDMLNRIKGADVAINAIRGTTRELGLVVRFKGQHKQLITYNCNSSGILSRNAKKLSHLICRRIDDCNLIGLRQRHVRFLIVCKGNTRGLIKN